MKTFVLLVTLLLVGAGVSVSTEIPRESLLGCSTSDTPPKQSGKS
jgi:hypothetical protein